MDGGAWWATVHRVAKSQTRLSHFTSILKIMLKTLYWNTETMESFKHHFSHQLYWWFNKHRHPWNLYHNWKHIHHPEKFPQASHLDPRPLIPGNTDLSVAETGFAFSYHFIWMESHNMCLASSTQYVFDWPMSMRVLTGYSFSLLSSIPTQCQTTECLLYVMVTYVIKLYIECFIIFLRTQIHKRQIKNR